MSDRAAAPLRHRPPPTTGRLLLRRPRLLGVLAGRFERRVTVLRAGAGFGKTTLLAQAVEANRMDPAGVDVWLGCEPADESADHLVSGLLDSLGAGGDVAAGVPAVVDAVWARAPHQVAILLDDLHHVPAGSTAAEVVARLVDELPANGHLVIGSRLPPPAPLARLKAQGAAQVVEEAALAFDEAELEAFAEERGVDRSAVERSGGWPALAELQAGSDRAVAADFLWEEVLDRLPEDRRRALALLAPFGDFDDEIVAAVTGARWPAADLVGGLPLVTVGGGQVRLHDLWRDVLEEPAGDVARRARRPGVILLQGRGQFREAFDVLAAGDDVEGMAELVDRLARLDFPELRSDDFAYVLKHSPREVTATAQGALLRAGMLFAVDGAAALEALESAAARFAEANDRDGEALALARRLMVHFWQSDLAGMAGVLDRLDALAGEGVEHARRSIELSGAYASLIAGDPGNALARVRDHGLQEVADLAPLAGLLVATANLDLGRPEVTRATVEVALPAATGQLRGGLIGAGMEADLLLDLPDEAELRPRMAEADDIVRYYGVTEHLALTSAALAVVALRYGWVGEAENRLAEARAAAADAVGYRARAAVDAAAAELAVAEGDEASAATILRSGLDGAQAGGHLDRSFLRSLPLLHLLVPEARELTGAMADSGPAWDLALACGRALVALREDDAVDQAAALEWGTPGRIRAVTAVPLVAELAVAAHAAGAPAAAGVLEGLPLDARAWLRAARPPAATRITGAIDDLLGRVAARPAQAIEIRVLGPVELWRGGRPVSESLWARERVRSLLQLVVDRRRVSRERAAAEMWPDLDDPAATNNLRVNLRHLQGLLEPDRHRDDPPWFLRSSELGLELVASDLLVVDVDDFERLAGEAREADRRRLPGDALDRCLAAVGRYRGDYLQDAPDPSWGEFDRVRLRAEFVHAANRAAELLLAVAEPDEALRLAGRAVEAEPFIERSHRLFVQALWARGERATAWRRLTAVVDQLVAEDLTPEPETLRLLEDLRRAG